MQRGLRKERTMKYIDRHHIPGDRRPLGFWLRVVDGQLRTTMREAFAGFGVTRREWRVLAALQAGPAPASELPAPEPLLARLVDRGWATRDGDDYAATAEGTRIHDAVLSNVRKLRAQVTAGIPDADYATTLTTLERVAGNIGWKPGMRPARRRGHHGPRPDTVS
jgi:hypothetical protein